MVNLIRLDIDDHSIFESDILPDDFPLDATGILNENAQTRNPKDEVEFILIERWKMLFFLDFISISFVAESAIELILKFLAIGFQLNLMLESQIEVLHGHLIEF